MKRLRFLMTTLVAAAACTFAALPAAHADDTITLKMAHQWPDDPNDYVVQTGKKFAQEVMQRSGGKMHIDGCYNLFRRFNPDVVALVSNPVLSVQKGSPSSLNNRPWYEGPKFGRMLVGLARSVRDELWRRTGLHYPPIHPR